MIRKAHRFRGHNSLNYVYQRGRTVRGPLFAIKYILNPKRESYRAAVVISRKVHKSAIGRNRIRRRLYECLRLLEDQINQPYDIVVTIYHDSVLTESYTELQNQLTNQLHDGG